MDKTGTPTSIGIIMDGNRRWAKQQGLLALKGHEQGAEKLKEVITWSKEKGIANVTVYAFSTENWARAEEEVKGIIRLLEYYVTERAAELAKEASVRFIGDRSRFSDRLVRAMEKLEEDSKGNTLTLAIAVSYGGRADIMQAFKKLVETGTAEITEDSIAAHLYTSGMPDPDLIIRTGGQRRLSNFLTWQSVYSELMFTDTFWPALTKEEFEQILVDFSTRKRNFGA